MKRWRIEGTLVDLWMVGALFVGTGVGTEAYASIPREAGRQARVEHQVRMFITALTSEFSGETSKSARKQFLKQLFEDRDEIPSPEVIQQLCSDSCQELEQEARRVRNKMTTTEAAQLDDTITTFPSQASDEKLFVNFILGGAREHCNGSGNSIPLKVLIDLLTHHLIRLSVYLDEAMRPYAHQWTPKEQASIIEQELPFIGTNLCSMVAVVALARWLEYDLTEQDWHELLNKQYEAYQRIVPPSLALAFACAAAHKAQAKQAIIQGRQ